MFIFKVVTPSFEKGYLAILVKMSSMQKLHFLKTAKNTFSEDVKVCRHWTLGAFLRAGLWWLLPYQALKTCKVNYITLHYIVTFVVVEFVNAHQLRVQNEQFSEEKGFILRYTENEA